MNETLGPVTSPAYAHGFSSVGGSNPSLGSMPSTDSHDRSGAPRGRARSGIARVWEARVRRFESSCPDGGTVCCSGGAAK
jgi:hypothetical protein